MFNSTQGESFNDLMFPLKYHHPSPQELRRISGELQNFEPGDEAKNWADHRARDEGQYEASYPRKYGVLSSLTKELKWRLQATLDQLANCRDERMRLSEIVDVVSDNLDTIGDADPDLAKRLGQMMEGEQ